MNTIVDVGKAIEARPEGLGLPPEAGPGRVIWITGLSGAGKTTLAEALLPLLPGPTLWYDGDVLGRALAPMRAGLSPEEVYSREERLKRSRVCSGLYLMAAEQGLTVVCSTITMFHEIQDWNRANLPGYVEIFLDMPEETLKQRDFKQVYGRGAGPAVGRQIPPEFPRRPDIHFRDPRLSPALMAELVRQALAEMDAEGGRVVA